jgi:hypothetical protein
MQLAVIDCVVAMPVNAYVGNAPGKNCIPELARLPNVFKKLGRDLVVEPVAVPLKAL